jgi:hypothetical protein
MNDKASRHTALNKMGESNIKKKNHRIMRANAKNSYVSSFLKAKVPISTNLDTLLLSCLRFLPL